MYGKNEIVELLRHAGVPFDMEEHEAVYTMEGMQALELPFASDVVKNLFVRDDKKRAYYLVSMPEDRPCNMKALRAELGSRPLRFASEDDLDSILGIKPGAVSPFGILNDEERRVTFVVDRDVLERGHLGIHPNDNTATLRIAYDDLAAIVRDHGNDIAIVDLGPSDEVS